jgi:hypothetical protein
MVGWAPSAERRRGSVANAADASVPQRAALTGVAEAFAAKNRDTPRRNPQRELPGPDALSRPLTTMFARRPKRSSEWLATIERSRMDASAGSSGEPSGTIL